MTAVLATLVSWFDTGEGFIVAQPLAVLLIVLTAVGLALTLPNNTRHEDKDA